MGRYERAVAECKKAVSLAPSSHIPYSDLAYVYLGMWLTQQSDDPQILDQAMAAAAKAQQLNESSWSHNVLSAVHLFRKQYAEAIVEAESAIALGGRHAASLLGYVGRAAEAIEITEPAIMSPHSQAGIHLTDLGFVYRLSHRQIEAIESFERVFQHYPSHVDAFRARLGLTIAYAEIGRMEEVKANAAELLKLVPNFSVDVYGQRIPYKDPAQTERDMAALRKAGLK